MGVDWRTTIDDDDNNLVVGAALVCTVLHAQLLGRDKVEQFSVFFFADRTEHIRGPLR